MKKILLFIPGLFLCCNGNRPEPKFPQYSITSITYIPDSLKEKHRSWVLETVRAANQHLSAGDYEDIDETIEQAQETGDNLFGKTVIGLQKESAPWVYEEIKPEDFSPREKKVFDSLSTLNYNK